VVLSYAVSCTYNLHTTNLGIECAFLFTTYADQVSIHPKPPPLVMIDSRRDISIQVMENVLLATTTLACMEGVNITIPLTSAAKKSILRK
jgi:hypothetical protein